STPPLRSVSGAARRRSLRRDTLHRETPRRVVFGKLGPQAPPTQRDQADPAPVAVAFLEHGLDDLLRRAVALAGDDARVRVLDLGAAFLKLPDRQADPVRYVQRLKPRDDHWHAEARHQRFILPIA